MVAPSVQPGAAVVRSNGGLQRFVASNRFKAAILGVAGIATAISAMELATELGVVHARDVPPAFNIIQTLFQNMATSSFWNVIGETMSQFAIGFAIAVAIGIPLGLAIGASDLLWQALRPTIEFFRPVPPVAFLALLILLYGPSATSAIILVVFGSVWVLLIQAIYGMRDRDEVMRETARSLRLGWWRRLWSVTLPSILPYLATGIRLGVAYALIACISAEILVSSPGLGAKAWIDMEDGNIIQAYSFILAAGLLGCGLHIVFTRLESRYLKWHVSQRTDRV